MLARNNKNSGFTLVEILISLLLGALLLAMIIGLYVTNVQAGEKAAKFSRLRTDLHALLALMEDDIRRAGYGGSDFMVGVGKSKVIDSINTSDEKCIVYSYNFDDSSAASSTHFMGFRYDDTDKTVQFGRGVNIQAVDCYSSGSWLDLTDPNFIQVTDLAFIESEVSSAAATIRSVEISVAGELTSDSDYTYSTDTQVKVRNIEF